MWHFILSINKRIFSKKYNQIGNLRISSDRGVGHSAQHASEFSRDLELQRIVLESDAVQIMNAVKATQ